MGQNAFFMLVPSNTLLYLLLLDLCVLSFRGMCTCYKQSIPPRLACLGGEGSPLGGTPLRVALQQLKLSGSALTTVWTAGGFPLARPLGQLLIAYE